MTSEIIELPDAAISEFELILSAAYEKFRIYKTKEDDISGLIQWAITELTNRLEKLNIREEIIAEQRQFMTCAIALGWSTYLCK